MRNADRIAVNLARIVAARGDTFGIVASGDGQIIAEGGSAAVVEADDLRRALFGDAGAVARLYASLEGQLQPRVWSQAPVRCAVCTPAPDIVVGIFERSAMSAAQAYREFAALMPELTEGQG